MTDYPPTDDTIVAMRREFRANLAAIMDGRDPVNDRNRSSYRNSLAAYGLTTGEAPPRPPMSGQAQRRAQRVVEARHMRANGYSLKAIAERLRMKDIEKVRAMLGDLGKTA